jgi:4-hydroxybenzoate polyprenyltransferase
MVLERGIKRFGDYMSLVKFSHTVFAMPFALIGFFLAINGGHQDSIIKLLLLVILCMMFARNNAMSFNRYADRDIDALNPRTLMREIPAEIIKPKSALFFTFINGILFIITTFFINKLCFYLSPLALLIINGYSYTKRFTALSHLVLGLGLSLAPIGAYIAVAGHFAVLPVIFSIIVLFWVAGFDIIYSLQDIEFDRTQRLKSIPAWIGKMNAIIVSIILHAVTAVFVVIAGIYRSAGIYFWTGAVIFIFLLIYQHLLVKPNDISRVNIAFATLNGIGSIIFAGLTVADIYYH